MEEQEKTNQELQSLKARIESIKKKLIEDKQKIFETLFINDPTPLLMNKEAALQMVIGIRGTNNLMKLLDEGYQFELKEIPSYIG